MFSEDPTLYLDWICKFMFANYKPGPNEKITDQRKITAYHEAGHITVAHIFELNFVATVLNPVNPKHGYTIHDNELSKMDYREFSVYYLSGVITQYLYTGESSSEGFCKDYIWLITHDKYLEKDRDSLMQIVSDIWGYFLTSKETNNDTNILIHRLVNELISSGKIDANRLEELSKDLDLPIPIFHPPRH